MTASKQSADSTIWVPNVASSSQGGLVVLVVPVVLLWLLGLCGIRWCQAASF
jgi:hypothetical protein